MFSLISKSVVILGLIIVMIAKFPTILNHNIFMVSGLRGVINLQPPSQLGKIKGNRYDLPINCSAEFQQRLTNRLSTVDPVDLSSLKWLAICGFPVEDLRIQSHSEKPLYRLFAGWIMANTEGLDEAVLIWRDQPEISDYFANLAVSLLDQSRYDDAVFFAQLSANTGSLGAKQNPKYYYVMCSYLVEQERFDHALDYCQNLAEIEQNNSAFLQLGRVYYQLGNYSKAYDFFSKGDKVIHLVWQARSKYALGELDESESLFIKALDQDPQNRRASIDLIQLYLDSERPCDAQRILKNWLAGEPCELSEKGVPKKYCSQLMDDCEIDLRD